MSSLSEEEENYVRMSLLLTGLSPRAVRALFDKEFPPASLPSTLNKKSSKLLSLQKNKVINQAQWNLLFPPQSGVADSKTFDVTLMICLIRNLTSVTPPSTGFDCLPSTVETTPGADLARIKYYRNYLAHLTDNKIDKSDFTTAWNDISDAVQRLGGSSMYNECQDLKTKTLDQSNQEIMLEMNKSLDEIKDLKTSVRNLKRSHDCLHDNITQEVKKYKTAHKKLKRSCKLNARQTEKLKTSHAQTTDEIKEIKHGHKETTKEIEMLKDTVPWNIKEQMTIELENWKNEDEMFVDTRAASHVLQCIKTNSCVTVTASSGVGKTFTVRHVALQMAADGYDILPVTDPQDIVRYHNPNKKTLYVIDDLCGTYTLNQTYLDQWEARHKDITERLKNDNTKIIASCRLQVYGDEQFKLLPLFKACECNLLVENMSLSTEEKQLIAEKYLESYASKISQYIDLFDFFPLLCRLYKQNKTLNVEDFFKNPFSVYEEMIKELNTQKAYGKYCALALCVMFNNHLKEEWLTEDIHQDIKLIIENTCEACTLNKGTSRLLLQNELDSLVCTFLKKEKGCYRTIHDKLFDFLSFYFGNTPMITCIIKNGDGRLISERLVFKEKADTDQFTTIVPDNFLVMYIERMFDEWSKGEVGTVFTSNNMKSQEFRNIFFMHLKNLDKTYQKQLATKLDNAAYTYEFERDAYRRMHTPLLHCCAMGDINMVEWCCRYGADVNYCYYGETPLCKACQGGYIDIVTKLLDNKADINLFFDDDHEVTETPLSIASRLGYTDIVTRLLDNGADVDMCWNKTSPLYFACLGGFTDIVNKLVDNKADVNMCPESENTCIFLTAERRYTEDGESPLYIACKGGYTEMVTKLVDNKADINMCHDGESPLYIACKGGHRDIVTKLLYNKADINMCTDNGESPLYTACEEGYTDIVTKLVENKADINRCRYGGESPLYIACKGGYTDIVKKLVDNKADINMRTDSEESPLYIACKGGYTDIVKKLVDNKADINMCTDEGKSPLYIACKGGYTDVVSKLYNKADINKCTWKEKSPLYIACKGGYTDIVSKLVDNKADINKCTWKEQSPLYIACKGGYTDIVYKLVANKADINKFTNDRESPMYVACKGGYTDIVTKLLDNKADINMCTDNGESPLCIACKGGYTDVVTTLVENKADMNKCAKDGYSPLHIACHQGIIEMVKILTTKGADLTICDEEGQSPLDIARLCEHNNIVEYITHISSVQ